MMKPGPEELNEDFVRRLPDIGLVVMVNLVRYPSRAAFLDMMDSAEYADANVHREDGVDEHLILASAETYSKFPVG